MLAIDPSAFGDVDAFLDRVTKVVEDIASSTRLPSVDSIHIPGEGAAATAAKRMAAENSFSSYIFGILIL